jgi:uncharacterized membrane protein YbhN (UPF0104 family)
MRPAVGLGLLALLFVLVPFGEVAGHLAGANFALLGVALAIVLADMLVSAFKLWLLVRTAHEGIGFGAVVRSYYVGAFFNNFLPTSVGGDVVKVSELHREDVPLGHATASVVVERGLGVAVVLALAAVVPVVWGGLFRRLGVAELRWPLAAVGWGAFAMLGLLYGAWRMKLKAALQGAREARVLGRVYRTLASFYVFRDNPSVLLAGLALSGVFYSLLAVNMVVVTRALGALLPLSESAGILPIRRIPEMLPVSVGALGVREGMTTFCLSRLGVGPAVAAAVAVGLRLLTYVHSAAGGIIYVLSGRAARPVTDSLKS